MKNMFFNADKLNNIRTNVQMSRIVKSITQQIWLVVCHFLEIDIEKNPLNLNRTCDSMSRSRSRSQDRMLASLVKHRALDRS